MFWKEKIRFKLGFINDHMNTHSKKVILRSFTKLGNSCVSHSLYADLHFLVSTWFCSISLDYLMLLHFLGLPDAVLFLWITWCCCISLDYLMLFHFLGSNWCCCISLYLLDAVPSPWISWCCCISLYLPNASALSHTYLILLRCHWDIVSTQNYVIKHCELI